MAKLNGLVIADPRKAGMSFSLIATNLQAEAASDKSLPHFTVSKTDKTKPLFPSDLGFPTNRFMTVPITPLDHKEIRDVHIAKEAENIANVESFDTEAEKWTTQQGASGVNGGAFYDPKGMYKTQTFKRTDRSILRITRNPATRLPAAMNFAREKNYVYSNGKGNYQQRFYANNPWKDPDNGRIYLFEAPRQATRLP